MVPEYVTMLDAESSYSGNTKDFVLVGNGSVEGEAIWRALDVPYRLAGIINDFKGITISADASLDDRSRRGAKLWPRDVPDHEQKRLPCHQG